MLHKLNLAEQTDVYKDESQTKVWPDLESTHVLVYIQPLSYCFSLTRTVQDIITAIWLHGDVAHLGM